MKKFINLLCRLIFRKKDLRTTRARTMQLVMTKEWIFQRNLDCLLDNLREQTLSKITYDLSKTGKKVLIYCEDDLLAEIMVFPKGAHRRKIYFGVRLEPPFVGLSAWFQLAFVGSVVRFRKPILTLTQEFKD